MNALVRIAGVFILLAGWHAPAAAGMGDWMPYKMVDGEFVVSAKVEGVETQAALATDLIVTSVNEGFLKRNGIPYNRKGNLEITFMGADLDLWQPPFYEDETDIGLRVYPWFKVEPVRQIDFSQQKIRFLPARSTRLYRKDNVRVRSGTITSGNPAGRIDIDGQELFMAMAQPRATFTTVSRDLALRSGWIEKYRIDPAKLGKLAEGLGNYEVMQVPNVKLGPFEFEYAIIIARKASEYDDRIVTDLDDTVSEARFYDGVLGLDILQNFVMTYDPNRRKIHIYAP